MAITGASGSETGSYLINYRFDATALGSTMTQHTYSARDAATAARMNVNTLRSWVQRDIIPLEEGERVRSIGTGHNLGRDTVVKIAIAGALVQAGLTPAKASLLASRALNRLSLPEVEHVSIAVDVAGIERRVSKFLDLIDATDFDAEGNSIAGEIVG